MSKLEAVVLKIKPEIWTKHDGKRYVMLSLQDFEKIQDIIEDAGLSRLLRESKQRQAGAPNISHQQMKRMLGITAPRKRKAG
jgi:hypothetical protein